MRMNTMGEDDLDEDNDDDSLDDDTDELGDDDNLGGDYEDLDDDTKEDDADEE